MARVLIIDDDPNLLQMLGLMLERANHVPILASHGEEGIKTAIEQRPDLAIVDVMMPDMSGHEVCRRLRGHPTTVDLPLLILTARAQSVDREAALESGATDFMTKPVSPKELASKVDELLHLKAEPQRGRAIAFCSLRGGVGVTTLAVNLAAALRSQQVPNVTLVDLAVNSGHVALQMRLQPKRAWTRLLEHRDLDAETVRSALLRHPSGINVLPAPVTPTLNASLSERQTHMVVETLVSRADFVVIDTPAVLNPMCVGALKMADLVMIILTPEIASIQTTIATLRQLVGLGISGKKVHLLLNHLSSQDGLPKQAVERGLNRSVSFQTPFDPYQIRALAQGTPLAMGETQSPLAQAMRRMAAALKKAA